MSFRHDHAYKNGDFATGFRGIMTSLSFIINKPLTVVCVGTLLDTDAKPRPLD